MAKKRVHEIAKEQGLTSKELLAKLQAAGIEVKAAASSVEEAEALKALGGNGAAPKAQAPAEPEPAAPRATAAARGGRAAGRRAGGGAHRAEAAPDARLATGERAPGTRAGAAAW